MKLTKDPCRIAVIFDNSNGDPGVASDETSQTQKVEVWRFRSQEIDLGIWVFIFCGTVNPHGFEMTRCSGVDGLGLLVIGNSFMLKHATPSLGLTQSPIPTAFRGTPTQ